MLADFLLSTVAGVVAGLVLGGGPKQLEIRVLGTSHSDAAAKALVQVQKRIPATLLEEPDVEGALEGDPIPTISCQGSRTELARLPPHFETWRTLQDTFETETAEWKKVEQRLKKELSEFKVLAESWKDLDSRCDRVQEGIRILASRQGELEHESEADSDTETVFLDANDSGEEELPGYEEANKPPPPPAQAHHLNALGRIPIKQALGVETGSGVPQKTLDLNITLNDHSDSRLQHIVPLEGMDVSINLTVHYLRPQDSESAKGKSTVRKDAGGI
ncbi:hypothetical protein PM082_008544 [Marasmius tenuissimus]|nr:hypothetical protein PM082_008544 [Marasmius tenuissimus]